MHTVILFVPSVAVNVSPIYNRFQNCTDVYIREYGIEFKDDKGRVHCSNMAFHVMRELDAPQVAVPPNAGSNAA